MARKSLRIIGILCLGGALLAGLAWREAYLKLFPIDQEAVLKAKQVISASFIPEVSLSPGESVYQMDFQFKDLRKDPLRCSEIRELSIKWAFSEDAKVREWNTFPSQNSDCKELGDRVIIVFPDLQFKPGIKQYLNVSVDSGGSSNNLEIDQSRIRVRLTRNGLDFHYGSIDIEAAALITGGFLSISTVCGLTDLVLLVGKKLQPQPNNLDAADSQD
jgi:hypothetical protein